MHKRERIPIQPDDLLRCPDRPTARWHRVVRVSRRKDGTRFITIRRSRIWRLLGLPAMQRIEWSLVRSLGYGIRKRSAPSPVVAIGIDEHPDGERVVKALREYEETKGKVTP